MQTFLASVFVFGILIFFHELGHFAAAKRAGILVHEFSMGFGPTIFGFKKGETVYNLRLFPLGGFVRMAGMDPEDNDFDDLRGFNKKTVGQRAATIAAGPIMNFVLAAVLFAIIFTFSGIPKETTDIGSVTKDFPAYTAGIQAGDKVVAINDIKVNHWNDMTKLVNKYQGQPLNIEVERNGQVQEINVTPVKSEDGRYIIGIMPELEKNPIKGLWKGIETTVQVTVLIISFIGKMLLNQAPADLAGPVRVVAEIGNAAEFGFFSLLQLAAFLSINLGLFNLFPIPALDGSRLVFLAWEKIAGKPVDPAKEGFIHMVGFGLLILLMVVITYKDVLNLVNPGGQ